MAITAVNGVNVKHVEPTDDAANVRVDENCFASILNSQSVYTKSALKGENQGYEEKVVIITGGGIGWTLAMAYAE
jgi:hypothetical protein